MVVTFIIFVVVLLVASVVVGTRKTAELQRKSRILESYMLSMQQLYQMLQERIDATRRYRHDLAKHIQTLEQLLEREDEKNQDLQSYVDGMKNSYRELEQPSICLNEIINAILTLKKEQCLEKKIPFVWSVENRSYSGIEDMDITGVLYNLLDNAVEENEKIGEQENRGIWFTMRETENMVQIEIRNKLVRGKKVTFLTGKENQWEHGIGTSVIKNIVEKYHGTRKATVDSRECMLYQQIILTGEE